MIKFLVQYKERFNNWTSDNNVMERRVPGNVTMVMLTDLIPSALYDIRVASVNAMGTSQFFFQGEFFTQHVSCMHTLFSMNSGVQDNYCTSLIFPSTHTHTSHTCTHCLV